MIASPSLNLKDGLIDLVGDTQNNFPGKLIGSNRRKRGKWMIRRTDAGHMAGKDFLIAEKGIVIAIPHSEHDLNASVFQLISKIVNCPLSKANGLPASQTS